MAGRSVNNAIYAGYQDVTIYPYQDVASIDADQILLDVVKPGVSNAYVTTAVTGDNVDITIHAGTMLVFRKSYTTTGIPSYTRDFIVKIVITEDIVIDNIPKTTFDSLDDDSIILIAAWDWEDAYLSNTNKYASFILEGASSATAYTNYLQYGDLVICEFLNHKTVIGGSYAYPVAYQNIYARQTDYTKVIKDYRNTFEHLNNGANQFNVHFGQKVVNHSGDWYTDIYVVSGYGVVRDTIFSIDEKKSTVAPTPLAGRPANALESGTYQVDILRIVVTDDVSNTPCLEWTSVSSETDPGTINNSNPLTLATALAVLGTQEIPFVNDGIIIGLAVRTRATIGNGSVGTPNELWPYQFARWNPLIPYVGHSSVTTRTKIPIYAEDDIDWA